MKNFTLLRYLPLFAILIFACITKSSAQTAAIIPLNANAPEGAQQSFQILTTGFGVTDNDRSFAFNITGPGATNPTTPATYPCTSGCDDESFLFIFPTAGVYTINVTVTQTEGGTGVAVASPATLTVWEENLFISFGDGLFRSLNVDPNTGSIDHGSDQFTSALTPVPQAMGKNSVTGSDPNGAVYHLNNAIGNGGAVNLYGSVANLGATEVLVASADINGGSTNDLNFARLGFDASGTGWILAGDGTDLYLASFTGNGTSATTINVLGTVTISGPGTIADFEDGDLAFSGSGNMYIVASQSGGGPTYVYTISSSDLASAPYTTDRKWALVQVGGANFTSPVTGIGFANNGAVHLTSGDDIFFISQSGTTISNGTIECTQVLFDFGTTFTDLASDNFPLLTILPVKLFNFGASINNNIVLLNWEAENEENFSHYEIERKAASATSFTTVGNKAAENRTGHINYQFTDNLSAVNDNVLYYRLKMVDLDGKFNYSQTIMVRKDGKKISGIKINPNPLIAGSDATLRFNTSVAATVSIRVIDMAGRIISEQQNRVSQGLNSIPVKNTHKLQGGMYILQMINGDQVESTTFTISQ